MRGRERRVEFVGMREKGMLKKKKGKRKKEKEKGERGEKGSLSYALFSRW
jgi:hypothetical protein